MAAKRGMQIGRFTGELTLTFQSPYLSRIKACGQRFKASPVAKTSPSRLTEQQSARVDEAVVLYEGHGQETLRI